MDFARTLLATAVVSVGALAASAPAAAQNEPKPNSFWWPDQIDLSPLRAHSAESNPYGEDFDYAAAFATLDLAAVKLDIEATLTDSHDWWPAVCGNYC